MLLRPGMGREGTSGFFQRTFDSGGREVGGGYWGQEGMPAYLFSSLLGCGALAPPLWVGGRERLQGRLAPGLALQPLPCRLWPLRYHVTINSLKDTCSHWAALPSLACRWGRRAHARRGCRLFRAWAAAWPGPASPTSPPSPGCLEEVGPGPWSRSCLVDWKQRAGCAASWGSSFFFAPGRIFFQARILFFWAPVGGPASSGGVSVCVGGSLS